MLETIREYAVERLHSENEAAIVQQRHAEWFASWAAEVPDADRPSELAPDDANLRLALSWGVSHDAALALALTRTLSVYWFYGGRMVEADHWGRTLLAAVEEPAGLRAVARALAGRFRLFMDDPGAARPLLEAAVPVLRRADDRLALAACLADLGMVQSLERRHEEAITILTEAVALHRELNAEPFEATNSLHFLGEALREAGHLDAARDRLQEVIAVLRDIGAEAMAASSTHSLGDLELDASRLGPAREHYCEALRVFRDAEMRREIANCLGGLAAVSAAGGSPTHAAELWGALEALENELELQLFEHERARYLRYVAAACDQHPAELARGRTWPLETAIALALNEASMSGAPE